MLDLLAAVRRAIESARISATVGNLTPEQRSSINDALALTETLVAELSKTWGVHTGGEHG